MRILKHTALLTLLAVFLAFPQLVEARAGGGSSYGSRGSQTYTASPYSAAPINRSVTPQQPASPSYSQPYNQPYGTTPYASGGHPILSGIAGGFLGASLSHMLFGGGYGGMGGGIGGSGIGLFELLIIGGLIYYFFKRSSGFNLSSMMPSQPYSAAPAPMLGGYTPQASNVAQPIAVTDADKHSFQDLLLNIQQSWSNGDMAKLRMYVTPEILQYFNEQLSSNSSRGLANKVERVSLITANMEEAWHEYDIDYATARLEWSAVDYMVRLDRQPNDADYVASGNNLQPENVVEFWTFMRANGGHWLLSAIQQAQ